MTATVINPHVCRRCEIAFEQRPPPRHGDFPTYEPLGYLDELGIEAPTGFIVLNGRAPCCGGFLARRTR